MQNCTFFVSCKIVKTNLWKNLNSFSLHLSRNFSLKSISHSERKKKLKSSANSNSALAGNCDSFLVYRSSCNENESRYKEEDEEDIKGRQRVRRLDINKKEWEEEKTRIESKMNELWSREGLWRYDPLGDTSLSPLNKIIENECGGSSLDRNINKSDVSNNSYNITKRKDSDISSNSNNSNHHINHESMSRSENAKKSREENKICLAVSITKDKEEKEETRASCTKSLSFDWRRDWKRQWDFEDNYDEELFVGASNRFAEKQNFLFQEVEQSPLSSSIPQNQSVKSCVEKSSRKVYLPNIKMYKPIQSMNAEQLVFTMETLLNYICEKKSSHNETQKFSGNLKNTRNNSNSNNYSTQISQSEKAKNFNLQNQGAKEAKAAEETQEEQGSDIPTLSLEFDEALCNEIVSRAEYICHSFSTKQIIQTFRFFNQFTKKYHKLLHKLSEEILIHLSAFRLCDLLDVAKGFAFLPKADKEGVMYLLALVFFDKVFIENEAVSVHTAIQFLKTYELSHIFVDRLFMSVFAVLSKQTEKANEAEIFSVLRSFSKLYPKQFNEMLHSSCNFFFSSLNEGESRLNLCDVKEALISCSIPTAIVSLTNVFLLDESLLLFYSSISSNYFSTSSLDCLVMCSSPLMSKLSTKLKIQFSSFFYILLQHHISEFSLHEINFFDGSFNSLKDLALSCGIPSNSCTLDAAKNSNYSAPQQLVHHQLKHLATLFPLNFQETTNVLSFSIISFWIQSFIKCFLSSVVPFEICASKFLRVLNDANNYDINNKTQECQRQDKLRDLSFKTFFNENFFSHLSSCTDSVTHGHSTHTNGYKEVNVLDEIRLCSFEASEGKVKIGAEETKLYQELNSLLDEDNEQEEENQDLSKLEETLLNILINNHKHKHIFSILTEDKISYSLISVSLEDYIYVLKLLSLMLRRTLNKECEKKQSEKEELTYSEEQYITLNREVPYSHDGDAELVKESQETNALNNHNNNSNTVSKNNNTENASYNKKVFLRRVHSMLLYFISPLFCLKQDSSLSVSSLLNVFNSLSSFAYNVCLGVSISCSRSDFSEKKTNKINYCKELQVEKNMYQRAATHAATICSLISNNRTRRSVFLMNEIYFRNHYKSIHFNDEPLKKYYIQYSELLNCKADVCTYMCMLSACSEIFSKLLSEDSEENNSYGFLTNVDEHKVSYFPHKPTKEQQVVQINDFLSHFFFLSPTNKLTFFNDLSNVMSLFVIIFSSIGCSSKAMSTSHSLSEAAKNQSFNVFFVDKTTIQNFNFAFNSFVRSSNIFFTLFILHESKNLFQNFSCGEIMNFVLFPIHMFYGLINHVEDKSVLIKDAEVIKSFIDKIGGIIQQKLQIFLSDEGNKVSSEDYIILFEGFAQIARFSSYFSFKLSAMFLNLVLDFLVESFPTMANANQRVIRICMLTLSTLEKNTVIGLNKSKFKTLEELIFQHDSSIKH